MLVKNFSNSGGSSRARIISISLVSLGRCTSLPYTLVLNNLLRQSVDSAAWPVALPFCKYEMLRRLLYVCVIFSNSVLIDSTVWFLKCKGVRCD